MISCYYGQLSQVFMNLIGNSINALNGKFVEIEHLNWQPEIKIITEAIVGKEHDCLEHYLKFFYLKKSVRKLIKLRLFTANSFDFN